MIESFPLSDDIVEDCAERIRQGATIEDCLNAYPAQARDLEPLLIIAFQSRLLPAPQLRPEVRLQVRRQMLRAVRNRSRPSAQRGWLSSPILRFALAFVATFFAMSGGLVAAQTSLPDSPLYGMKRASENLRLQFTSDPTARAGLYLQYSEIRFNEIVALSTAGRPVPESLIDQCAEQRDLAWQTLASLDPSSAMPLYQQYVSITERRIAALSTGTLAQSQSNRPALDQFLLQEQAALHTAQQQPVESGQEQPDPTGAKPKATETVPAQPLTPIPEPTRGKNEEPTAKPVDRQNPAHTPQPEHGNDGNNGNPTPRPENGNNGNPTSQPAHDSPTPQPENGNNGNPTSRPENGNNGNPTSQPAHDNPTPQPENGNNGNPAPQPETGNNGNDGNNGGNENPAPQPETGNNGNDGNNGGDGNNGNPGKKP